MHASEHTTPYLVFNSSIDRYTHPHLGLFNDYLWQDVFNNKISEQALATLEHGLGGIVPNDANPYYSNHKQQLLLCALLSKNTASKADILSFAKNDLGISTEDIFHIAGLACDVELARSILEQISPDERRRAFNRSGRLVLKSIATSKGLDAITSFLEMDLSSGETVRSLLTNVDYYRFYNFAAYNGSIDRLLHIELMLTEAGIYIIDALKADDYYAYRIAAANGQIDTLVHIESKLTEASIDIVDVIKAGGYLAYQNAAHYGAIVTLLHIESRLTEAGIDIIDAIKADDYLAYQNAAHYGDIVTLSHIESRLTEAGIDIIDAIKADDYYAYRFAAANGQIDTLLHIESKLTEAGIDIIDAIKADDYYAYHFAAANGQIDTLLHIESKLIEAGVDIIDAIKAQNYRAYHEAVFNGHASYLLNKNIPELLAYAESNDSEYGRCYVETYVEGLLVKLIEEKNKFETSNPNAVFDISANQTELYIYVIRNLIRRASVNILTPVKDEEKEHILGQLRELLMLPSLRNVFLHQSHFEGLENELLRYCIAIPKSFHIL